MKRLRVEVRMKAWAGMRSTANQAWCTDLLVLDLVRWAVTSVTATQNISSIFCYFWEGVYIGGHLCITFSAGLAVLLCFSVRMWGLSLDCEEENWREDAKRVDGVTRKGRERDVWFLFWMLFNTRSSFCEHVLLSIYILSNILVFGRLNLFRT